MITLTMRAAQKVKEIALAEGTVGQPLRLRVVGGGCAGFTYDIAFEDGSIDPLDETFDDKGMTLVVDPLSMQYLDETEVDYVEDARLGAGFRFMNPNSTGSCGCGNSFAVS